MKIAVACHKPYMQLDDDAYIYIHAGAALAQKPLPGLVPDSRGENISAKNRSYCELTALYYLWKNSDEDIIGLCHYRRYFAAGRGPASRKRIISGAELEKLMRGTDIILPCERHYYIESNYSQYVHAHHREDLDTLRGILAREYPGYLPAYDSCMGKTHGHRFNMFVMRRQLADSWCTWLFDVLARLEAELDISGYDDVSRRVFGYVAERLIDVWIQTNALEYKELPVVNLEGQNWPKKIFGFLRRKWRGMKNDKAESENT